MSEKREPWELETCIQQLAQAYEPEFKEYWDRELRGCVDRLVEQAEKRGAEREREKILALCDEIAVLSCFVCSGREGTTKLFVERLRQRLGAERPKEGGSDGKQQ